MLFLLPASLMFRYVLHEFDCFQCFIHEWRFRQVLGSTTDAASTLLLHVNASNAAVVSSILVDQSPAFNVTLDDGEVVMLYNSTLDGLLVPTVVNLSLIVVAFSN